MKRVVWGRVPGVGPCAGISRFPSKSSPLNGGSRVALATLTASTSRGSPVPSLDSQFSNPCPLKNSKRKGRVYVMDTATCSMKLARFMSRSERPAHSWVLRVMWTLLYTLNHSGWWSSFSACRATLVMKPNALLKSLKWNCLKIASRPSNSFHPTALRFGSSCSLSSALSLCALPAVPAPPKV